MASSRLQVQVWGLLLPWLATAAVATRLVAVPTTVGRLPRDGGHLTLAHGSASSNASTTQCGVDMRRHPDQVRCPSQCPFLRLKPTSMCEFTCVSRERCNSDDPLANFADPQSMRCMACLVSACEQCGSSANSCARCHSDFDLVDGSCRSRSRWLWNGLYSMLGMLGITVVAYVVILFLRPTVNRVNLELGLKFRSAAKTRNEVDGKLYDYFTTDLCTSHISGLAVMLHFRWQLIVMVWALCVLLILGTLGLFFRKRPEVQKHTLSDPKIFDACNEHVTAQVEDIANMEVAYFYGNLAIYLFTTIAGLAVAVYQRRWAYQVSDSTTTMQDYMLFASGLPKQPGSEPVEEHLKDFFQQSFASANANVVGVSVCWDYRDCAEEVERQVQLECDQYSSEWEELVLMRHSMSTDRSGDGEEADADGAQGKGRRCTWVDPKMRYFDALLGVKEQGAAATAETRQVETVRQMLENVRSSGYAYVVFESEAQRDRAYTQSQEQKLMYPAGVPSWCQFPVQLIKGDAEPEVVLWGNSGVTRSELRMNICKGIVVLIIATALMDLFFYFPYVTYILRCADIQGMTQGTIIQSTLLGMLICVCNQLIYFTLGHIADRCGFSTKDAHQQFYVVGYTAAVFINTIIDLFTVVLLAQGYSVDQAMQMHIDGSSSMSTKTIAENPSIQMSLYIQIWSYIFPSCLLLPFVLEPIANGALYLINTWLVRSRKVSARDAEALLQCPPFDLARYGDISINVMLCVFLCVFTYRDLWKMFACLVVSLMWIYAYDKYRFLRLTTRSTFVSLKMAKVAQWLNAAPCAILCSCLAFRLYAASDGRGDGFMEGLRAFDKHVQKNSAYVTDYVSVDRDTIVKAMVLAAVLHLTLHWAALHWLVPYLSEMGFEEDTAQKHLPYSVTAAKEPCNWFNANPLHCLRSRYFYEHKSPCVMFLTGREFLLKPNPDLGQYFKREAFEIDEEGLLETMQALQQRAGAARRHVWQKTSTFVRQSTIDVRRRTFSSPPSASSSSV